MAGTFRGKVECLAAEANEFLNSGVVFKNAFDVLEAHPQTTRIALSHGTGSGTDYPGEANPFGNGAFGCWRFDSTGSRAFDWYLFVSAAGITSGVTPSSLGLQADGANGSSSSGYVLCSAAVGVGGDGNPWNGTENNDGTDTIGTPLWANPGGGGTNVQVVPASNSTSGADGTNRNNCIVAFIEGTPGNDARHNIVCDDDTFVLTADAGDNGSVAIAVLGAFDANPGLASYPAPIFCFKRDDTASPSIGTDLGPDESGVSTPDQTVATWQAGSVVLVGPTDIFSSAFYPNSAEGLFDSFAVGLATDEISIKGYRGQSEFIQLTFGVPALDTDTAQNLFVSGTATTNQVKEVSPWDGATTPGTGVTKQGTDFTRTP